MKNRPRIIVTQDGEIDDKCSFVRFLFFANEYDIEGLIYANSRMHLENEGLDWMEADIEEYGKVLPNLNIHAPDDKPYPDKEYLLEKIRKGILGAGNVGTSSINDSNLENEGVRLISDVLLDKSDARPVWLLAWGGSNTITEAFYRIKKLYRNELERCIRKARLYTIWNMQEDKIPDGPQESMHWLYKNIPDLHIIHNINQFIYIAYQNMNRQIPEKLNYVYSKDWIMKNIKKNHGVLGSIYPTDHLQSEGDSPTYFYQIDTGLRSLENPSWGGWGGRFERSDKWGIPDYWIDAADEHDSSNAYMKLQKPGWRWMEDLQNDWAARADWSNTTDYREANHHPVVKLDHSDNISVKGGSNVSLSANGTYDPDGDMLDYTWWQYREAGTYDGSVDINDSKCIDASFAAPEGENLHGKTIHIILTVRDNGLPPLTRYRRIIVTLL